MSRIRAYLFHRYTLLLFSAVLLLSGHWLYRSSLVKQDPHRISSHIQSVIGHKEKQAEILIQETKETMGEEASALFQSFFFANEWREADGISLFVYQQNQLRFWSDNKVPYDPQRDTLIREGGMLKLRNGWYKLLSDSSLSGTNIVALIHIKHQYANRNRYLASGFVPAFGLPQNTVIYVDTTVQEAIPVYDQQGTLLFSVQLEAKDRISLPARYLMVGLIALGILLLLLFLGLECRSLERYIGSFYASVLLGGTVVLLRYVSLELEFPSEFYDFELFSPSLFAASFLLPSLGDFLINALLLFYVTYFFVSRTGRFRYNLAARPWVSGMLVVVLLLIVWWFAYYLGRLLQRLIEDSSIEFNVNNIFNLSSYSLVGFVIAGLLFFSFTLLCEFTLRVSVKLKLPTRFFLYAFSGTFALSLVLHHWVGVRDLIVIAWPAAILLVLFFARYVRRNEISFNHIVLLLITFSAFSAHSLSKYNDTREVKKRLVLAQKLSTEEDPAIEIAYSEMESDLLRSNLLHSAFDSSEVYSRTGFQEALENRFFSGEWNKFDLQFYLFAADSSPLGIEGFAPIRDFEELDELITENGVPSPFSSNLFFIYNSAYKLSYVIRLPVKRPGEPVKGFLFCELRSKKIPEDIGFPELLIDRSSQRIDAIYQYSYARYVDGTQVNHFGSYRYSYRSNAYENFDQKYIFREEGGYSHLFYRVDKRTLLVLSKPVEKFIQKATSFSYLFTLFGLMLIAGFALRQVSLGYASLALSLQGKVQALLVGLLFVSLVLFGLGTRYFIADQYQEKNNSIISEKIQSVRIEVLHKLGREESLSADLANYIGYMLDKLSGVFLTDINLYKPDGMLLATSRPKIIQSGLLAPEMDPRAFRQMSRENKSEYVQEERIGDLRYLSAYVPLLNTNDEVLGFLNLPYFARQSALETELSSFLVAIVNIFAVLFAISLLAALFASNWITQPLRLIQESISTIKPGKTNKPIEYHGKDEIGSLVHQYNLKVAELEKYARELARSERESAWREMARQVAHEIKNPLTPIRLTVQHMQRSLNPNDPDWQEKLNRFTATVIEQIDTLTHIAGEFSNFANMPRAREEKIDLRRILRNVADLYRETPGTTLVLNELHPHEAVVYCDRDQLLRVFNNLVKNAIQAIPAGQEGQVKITLDRRGKGYVVEVQDDGIGIAPEKMEKIFVPNFTTKSTGMGLGLAMVKNIVENAGGRVWFETAPGKGSSFFVWLPEFEGKA